jgi:hypothetical protein
MEPVQAEPLPPVLHV